MTPARFEFSRFVVIRMIKCNREYCDRYVGESESNIRKLFADAEEEWKRCGANSGLHIIIFDEIDAICKQRGSVVSACRSIVNVKNST